MLTLVAGGLPTGSRDLAGARERARDAVGELAPAARAAGVILGIEPFHPLLAADRSVVSTLGQALDIAEQFDDDTVGVIVDVWHVWWDPMLAPLIRRAGYADRRLQVADWLLSTPQLRGQPGSGVIDFEVVPRTSSRRATRERSKWRSSIRSVWSEPTAKTLAETVAAFDSFIAPALSRG